MMRMLTNVKTKPSNMVGTRDEDLHLKTCPMVKKNIEFFYQQRY